MNNFNIIVSRNPLFDKCPGCNGVGALHRSKARNVKESLVKSFTFFKIYRCRQCGWRGYRSSFAVTRDSATNLLYYVILILAAAFIIRYFLNRISG